MAPHRRGILSNTYIPQTIPLVTSKILLKLNRNSLFDLCLFWCKWSTITRPLKNPDEVYQEILEMQQKLSSSKSKRKLIDNILSEYWSKGLNLLQISQIDIQNLIDKPLNFNNWCSMTAKTTHNSKNFIINLNSQKFLNDLIKNLSNLYLSHIYISKHPHYPLILIRIQVFDYSISPAYSGGKRHKHIIVSRRPFFLAIPLNSPHIIHSIENENDLVSSLVLQSIENCLSNSIRQVRLFKDDDESSVKTLETMFLFKGNSRFSNCLGSWAPYADGTVDISPFGKTTDHFEVNKSRIYDDSTVVGNENENMALIERRKIANLRFKGTELPLESERLFEDDRPLRKKIKKSIAAKNEDDEGEGENDDVEDNEEQQEEPKINPYKSIAPVQSVHFKLKYLQPATELAAEMEAEAEPEIEHGREAEGPSIDIRMDGNDVFGGLHELAVKGILDPVKMPGWLTGENGNKYVNVEFDSNSKKTGSGSLI
ncbi:hypothetical protein PACTADRAFT_59656 [Pachysolen tannophilus NRRL Y-2460]|uniref:CHL4-domain-containing protein n=1 Tax=Pachysolen tannophilus NRRL Y-2460 TaxID=669874 RepID=A0A1E4TTH4_PACTA|nr:hypothetical protein PACTADRAFT_59656 [Pachysolen tannophilus NRRL Y-2460]